MTILLIFPVVFFHLRAFTNERQQNFFNPNYSVKSFKNLIKLGVHRRRTGQLWPLLVVHCCRALRHGITGGALTSGQCCQRTDLVPALPRPRLVVSELQPLGLPVTLALPDILNPCQSGNQAQTLLGERSPSPARYRPFPFAPINMQRNHTPERSDTRRPAQMCRKIYFLIFSSPLGGLLAWKWIKDFDFYTWNPPVFSVCVPSCAEPRPAFFWSPSLIFLDVRMGSTRGQITWLLWLQTLAFTKKLAEACVTPYGRPIDETVFILVWKMWLQ